MSEEHINNAFIATEKIFDGSVQQSDLRVLNDKITSTLFQDCFPYGLGLQTADTRMVCSSSIWIRTIDENRSRPQKSLYHRFLACARALLVRRRLVAHLYPGEGHQQDVDNMQRMYDLYQRVMDLSPGIPSCISWMLEDAFFDVAVHERSGFIPAQFSPCDTIAYLELEYALRSNDWIKSIGIVRSLIHHPRTEKPLEIHLRGTLGWLYLQLGCSTVAKGILSSLVEDVRRYWPLESASLLQFQVDLCRASSGSERMGPPFLDILSSLWLTERGQYLNESENFHDHGGNCVYPFEQSEAWGRAEHLYACLDLGNHVMVVCEYNYGTLSDDGSEDKNKSPFNSIHDTKPDVLNAEASQDDSDQTFSRTVQEAFTSKLIPCVSNSDENKSSLGGDQGVDSEGVEEVKDMDDEHGGQLFDNLPPVASKWYRKRPDLKISFLHLICQRIFQFPGHPGGGRGLILPLSLLKTWLDFVNYRTHRKCKRNPYGLYFWSNETINLIDELRKSPMYDLRMDQLGFDVFLLAANIPISAISQQEDLEAETVSEVTEYHSKNLRHFVQLWETNCPGSVLTGFCKARLAFYEENWHQARLMFESTISQLNGSHRNYTRLLQLCEGFVAVLNLLVANHSVAGICINGRASELCASENRMAFTALAERYLASDVGLDKAKGGLLMGLVLRSQEPLKRVAMPRLKRSWSF